MLRQCLQPGVDGGAYECKSGLAMLYVHGELEVCLALQMLWCLQASCAKC